MSWGFVGFVLLLFVVVFFWVGEFVEKGLGLGWFWRAPGFLGVRGEGEGGCFGLGAGGAVEAGGEGFEDAWDAQGGADTAGRYLFLERAKNLLLQLVGQADGRGAGDERGLGLLGRSHLGDDVLVAGAAAARVVVGGLAAVADRRLGDQVLVGPHHLLDALVADVGRACFSREETPELAMSW